MALMTRAQGAAIISPLSVVPGAGEKYASLAAISLAIGNMQIWTPGQWRVKWTNGIDGQYVETDAGLVDTADTMKYDETFTVDIGALYGKAATDVVSDMIAPGELLGDSLGSALAGINRKDVSGLVGEDVGTLNTLLGVQAIVAKTIPAALGQTVSGSSSETSPSATYTTYSAANFVQDLNKLDSLLPPHGENIVVCNNEYILAVKSALASVFPGSPFSEALLPNYDFPVLRYSRMLFYAAPDVFADVTDAQDRKIGHAALINNSPEGMIQVFPKFTTPQNLKLTTSQANHTTVARMYLFKQYIPKTPRACAFHHCFLS